jgi:hypothetical protein
MKNLICILTVLFLFGCASSKPISTLSYSEPNWVREGEAIELEGKSWYPLDVIEHFQDDEMLRVGEFRNESVYVERRDVKPYDRLYMKIDVLTFRAFQGKKEDASHPSK